MAEREAVTAGSSLSAPSDPRRNLRAQYVHALLILAAGLIAYHNSLGGPFIFDDHNAIELNPAVRSLWPLWRPLVPPPDTSVSGRPMVSLSFALNYAAGGLNPRGYHLVNLTIHLLNAMLLWSLLRRLLASPRVPERIRRSRASIALATTLLWVAHPLLTESVTYVINRTETMMSLALLATLYCVARADSSAKRAAWYATAVVSCTLGMGCKEVMVVTPLLVLAQQWLFVEGSLREIVRRRWRLYAGLAATWIVVPILLWLTVSFRSKSGGGLEAMTVWQNLLTQAGAIVQYLRLSFWPAGLTIDYDDWPRATSLREVWPQAMLIIVLLIATGWGVIRRRPWSFVGVWFFVILAPTSSFLPLGTEIVAERRMYLPLAAIVLATVLMGWGIGRWVRDRWNIAAPVMLRLEASTVGLITLALVASTVWRNSAYQTQFSIYRDAAAKRPNNARVLTNLAIVQMELAMDGEAESSLRRALKVKPDLAKAHHHLGTLLQRRGDMAGAARAFAAAANASPGWMLPRLNLGALLVAQGRPDLGEKLFAEAVLMDPKSAQARLALADALARRGDRAEAIRQLREAQRLDPAMPGIRDRLIALGAGGP